MPYGIAKRVGGDSTANDSKMERCVQKLTPQHGKLKAILICKASIDGTTKR